MRPADHPLVRMLPESAGADLVARVTRVSHSAGSVILAEGTLSTDFFLILEGTVETVRGGEVLATLEAGSFFGELGAQDAGPGYAMARNATVRALTAWSSVCSTSRRTRRPSDPCPSSATRFTPRPAGRVSSQNDRWYV